MVREYRMKISRMTVDKLGVKLYDRVYAVIAELISNSYDADATEVTVRAPMGQYLARRESGKVISKNVSLEVEDNGIGMTPEELQDFYLVVGKERRNDPKQGELSKIFKRKVMGRKGVGKLAPFGVCRTIEVISAGGLKICDEKGSEGYRTAHLTLEKDKILSETDEDYKPKTGDLDGSLSPRTFTKIMLTDFDYRLVGSIEDLRRQLSQRFGLSSENWCITLLDSNKSEGDPSYKTTVGSFYVPVMENSKLKFWGPSGSTQPIPSDKPIPYEVHNPDGSKNNDLKAGFIYENRFYPVVGWIAYAKEPYKDELMAGVRIYCRGKFAAQSLLFNRKAGFTGEHSIRSYLVGELHADWLDEEEDLIQTDRRDILWSHELGSEFQTWGQEIVLKIGQLTRDPMRKSILEKFLAIGNVDEKVNKAFPDGNQRDLRQSAMEIAKILGKSLRGDEVDEPQVVDDLIELSLLLAPLRTLDEMLREAGSEEATPLNVVTDILKTARIAEVATFGHQIEKRLRIIERLESLKDSPDTVENELQKLIYEAPWLVNPQWIPITSNKKLKTFQREFEKFYKERTGNDIKIQDFSESGKQPDFVMFSQDGKIQIIEIKKPKHILSNDEMDRIITYIEQFDAFISDGKHKDFSEIANDFKITLVCDGESLKGAQKKSYESYISEGKLTALDWAGFLLRTTKTHQEFMDEAERLKRRE